eukprot:6177720-Pleurochrysis_carterae.AAC.1
MCETGVHLPNNTPSLTSRREAEGSAKQEADASSQNFGLADKARSRSEASSECLDHVDAEAVVNEDGQGIQIQRRGVTSLRYRTMMAHENFEFPPFPGGAVQPGPFELPRMFIDHDAPLNIQKWCAAGPALIRRSVTKGTRDHARAIAYLVTSAASPHSLS